MKKLFVFLLVFLPMLASAEKVEIKGICYNVIIKAQKAEVVRRQSSSYSGNIVIPKSITYDGVTCKVTTISDNAFSSCDELTSVTIPSSVTDIGKSAFSGCEKLTSVTIPNSVTSMGGSAFYNCSGLTSVTIGSGLTMIENSAFNGCTSLTTVTIANGVSAINNYAFENCVKLTSVKLPNSLLGIGQDVFYNCRSLKSIIIPNSVTFIGDEAFTGCSALTSVTIGNSVTYIGDNAFEKCTSLKSVTIPNSVTYLGSMLFTECSSLTSATIGNNVTEMGSGTFSYCTSLKSAIIPNSVTDLGQGAFYGCSSLASVTIGNSVKTLGYGTFYQCTSLTSVNIPNSVTSIGSQAFYECKKLAVVGIGSGIEDIYSSAFEKCERLTDVYCFAEKVPYANSYSFRDCYIEYATLHVPAGSLDAYKAKTPWSGFMDKVQITGKVKLNKTELSIQKDKTETLIPKFSPATYPDQSVTWKSSDKSVVLVTSAGKIKGLKAGTATITCTSASTGTKAKCKVTVVDGGVKLNKTKATIEKGKTVTLTATVTPSTLSDKSVTWKSSNKKVATVSSSGKVKGVKAGTATITCTSKATGLSATCEVTVGYVKLDQTEVTVKAGKAVTLKATVYPSSLEDRSVTWKSSNTKVATVSSKGKVKGVKAGTATITCTSKATGLKTTCIVTVTAAAGSRSLDGDGDDELTGIEEVTERLTESPAVAEPFDVFDLGGRKVLHQVTSLDGLPDGIYIVKGKKILKKN
jgi:uncharacterized protein YjdB